MTAIGYSAELDESKYSFDCGGSLISLVSLIPIRLAVYFYLSKFQNFVLTAGHCVNSRVREPKVVRFGRVSLQDYKEDETDPNEAQLILVKVSYLYSIRNMRLKINPHSRKLSYIQNILRERSTMISLFWKWLQIFSTKKSSSPHACTPKASHFLGLMT